MVFCLGAVRMDCTRFRALYFGNVGNFAFASATQGWFVARNKIWELPLLLAVTLSLMRPDLIASLIGIPHEQRYWTYLIGLGIYGLIYLMQRPRIPKVETVAAAA